MCGDSYGVNGQSDNCESPCSGDTTVMCGGAEAYNAYRVDLPGTYK